MDDALQDAIGAAYVQGQVNHDRPGAVLNLRQAIQSDLPGARAELDRLSGIVQPEGLPQRCHVSRYTYDLLSEAINA